METPKHIKYLSFVFFLNAAFALFISGMTFISMIYSTLASKENLDDLSTVVFATARDFGLNLLFTILAVFLLIFLGVNLRKLRPWARTITLAYSILTIFLGLLSLLTGDRNFSYHFLVQIYAVWVLTRLEVKEAFNV